MKKLDLFGNPIWDESKHPRNDDGEFCEKGSSASDKIEPLRARIIRPLTLAEGEKIGEFKKNLKSTLTKNKKSGIINNIKKDLSKAKVAYRAVQPLKTPLSEREIITRLGGDDSTIGSCSSLAFAYIGNKYQLDVLDFRGGDSRDIFASDGTINAIANLPGVNGTVLKEGDDFKAAKRLMDTIKEGKEYYLGVGGHAAIVRKTQSGFEYLELQYHSKSNGFKPLTTGALKGRFKCQQLYNSRRIKAVKFSQLIESESLGKSDVFKELLGYINTAETKQRKKRR